MLKDNIIASCQFLLRPVIRFLLKHGVTWSEFAELSRDTYVAVARQDYGIQGRPTNNSRVSMLTGLSRREVANVRDRLLDDQHPGASLRGNRISQVLGGWHTDPEYIDAKGRPKDLSPAGEAPNFETLLRRYGGDLPHVAIRKELEQRNLISEQENGDLRVLKRDFVYSNLDPEIVQRMSVALHDHAATLEHNLDDKRSGNKRFEGMADNARLSPAKLRAFQDLVEKRGLELLKEIDAWLSANELDETNDAETHTIRLGVGVYLIHDDSK